MDQPTAFHAQLRPALMLSGRRAKRTIGWILFAILAIAGGVSAWRYATAAVTVTATRAARGPAAEVVYATGFVEPQRPVEVSSRVTAPVTGVLADEGDRVARGQALVTLDAEDQRQTIAQLTASRINAEQDERRSLALFRQGWITNEARDKAVAAANSARALEAGGRAKLNQYTIRAGISGVILRRDVEPGDLATSSKTLFEMGDPKYLRVTATVDERDIPLVRTGSAVMMSTEAYPGRILRGRVYEITPGGDPDQRAFRVRIRPDSQASLPIGLTLEVNILASQRERALLVPASAIQDGKLWLINNGRVRRVSVEVGIRGADQAEIKSGIADGDCIVSANSAPLKDGDRVIARGC